MGLFDFFLDAADVIGDVVGAIGDVVDKGVKWIGEKVAETFGLETKENTMRAIAKARKEAEEAKTELARQTAENAKKMADSLGDESYDVDTASANEIRLMNEELHTIQESFRKKAADIEESIIECVQGTVNDMLEQFENINDTAGLNLNIAYLKSMENTLRTQVSGYIQNRVRRFLSIDNQECKDILKMEGKTAKKIAMQRFQDKIISDAVNDLWMIVKDTFTEQNSAIFIQIDNRFRTIEMKAEESIRELEEIQRTKQQETETLKEKQDSYQSMIDIAKWCLESMEGEKLA